MKYAYTTYDGSRYQYVLADSTDGTPFGMGNTREEAIADAAKGESYYWDENDEWQVADRDWIDEQLRKHTLEIYSAEDLDEDIRLAGV